jgi:hypothetical protein
MTDMEQGSATEMSGVSSPRVSSTKHAGQRRLEGVPTDTVETGKNTRVRTVSISPRDRLILSFVGRFGQVTTKHIDARFFAGHKSRTSVKETVRRLTRNKLLARIEIRTVGGANGGSGQYVYQIGPAGWKAANMPGTYYAARSVKYHSLAIADVFIEIDARLNVTTFDTEPDSHERVNYVLLEPDLFVVLDLEHVQRRAWLEIDLGTERPKQLREKMGRYYHAWSGAPDRWRPWPFVVWVVPDEKRRAELESLIKLEPAESQGMYRVTLFEDVVETLIA